MDAPPPPGVTAYTYTLLHNRLLGLCDDLAADVEAAERGEVRGADPGARALGAIILAHAAIDAGVNHLAETAFPPRGMMPAHWPVHAFAFERLHWLNAGRRLRVLATMLRVPPTWEAEPWVASLRDHRVVRNALQHNQGGPVRASDGLATFPDELRVVAKRLGTWARYESGGTWLEAFLNATVARWAHRTAREVLHAIRAEPWRRSVPIPPSDLAPDGR